VNVPLRMVFANLVTIILQGIIHDRYTQFATCSTYTKYKHFTNFHFFHVLAIAMSLEQPIYIPETIS